MKRVLADLDGLHIGQGHDVRAPGFTGEQRHLSEHGSRTQTRHFPRNALLRQPDGDFAIVDDEHRVADLSPAQYRLAAGVGMQLRFAGDGVSLAVGERRKDLRLPQPVHGSDPSSQLDSGAGSTHG